MHEEFTVSGTALLESSMEARDVTIIVRDGIISSIEEERSVPARWIVPAFFNAHTHLADTVAMDVPFSGSIEELVRPPDGLKHKILRKTSQECLIQAMKSSISMMINNGTVGFADFREGGIDGVKLLKKASSNEPINSFILGRNGGEEQSDGAGISSTRDVKDYEMIARKMKKENKIVAFHAGEKDSLDIDDAIACEPDLLIHLTHATKKQIRMIADNGIAVAVCARSNFLTGVTNSSTGPQIREMIEAGIDLHIGTDNVMLVNPDIWQELSFIHTVYKIEPERLLYAASHFSPGNYSNIIKPGNTARFNVLDVNPTYLSYSKDIRTTLVKRASFTPVFKRVFYM